jgi:hypothetical protein
MTYDNSSRHTVRFDDATPDERMLARDLIALVEAGLVAPVEGPDGQLRIALADDPGPMPPTPPRCRARLGGPQLARLSQLPIDVRVALVDADPPFVVARSEARGVCSVAGPVLAHAVERVLGLPVVVATPRGVGGLLLLGDEPHLRAAARLDLAALRWVRLYGTRASAERERAAA